MRHAYDRGIRFFETSETYGEMHKMLGVALKGVPRDSYRLMSKVTTRQGVDPREKIDELASWRIPIFRCDADALPARGDVAYGHGAPAGRHTGSPVEKDHRRPRRLSPRIAGAAPVPGNKRPEIAMIRMNHKGRQMDAEDYNITDRGTSAR